MGPGQGWGPDRREACEGWRGGREGASRLDIRKVVPPLMLRGPQHERKGTICGLPEITGRVFGRLYLRYNY